MATKPSADPTIIKSPLCPFTPHCGAMAKLGPVEYDGESTSEERTVTCLRCGKTGTESRQRG